ncbi:hypothetical protein Vadar_032386 [Vaccinium darrowii]|uniref:Uncharacterized protein n=1 Tax=Vaccinium darrowii TaxID=229202 RepID=A0ACB7XWE9_9ERIC|nr:hypothetical protein Vadar_032386 [Vaccinium darrowii]
MQRGALGQKTHFGALRHSNRKLSIMVSPRKVINLGKKPVPTTQHRLAVAGADVTKIVRKGPRVVWDSQLTRVFLELAVKEIEKEGRSTTQLSNKSLARIAERISALTNLPVTPIQCKNRYQVLRRDWQAWQLLADQRRGATGLGFDHKRGTFTAPDFFWANLIRQNEHVAKFRDRRLDHEELMQRVFQEVTATGDYVYILAEHDTDEANPMAMEEEDRLEAEEFAEGAGNTIGIDVGADPGHTVGVDLGDEISTEGPTQLPTQENEAVTPPYPTSMPRYPRQESSGTKRKTPSSGTDELSQSMERILRNQNNRNLKPIVRMKHTPCDVSQMLSTMECFNVRPRPPLYWWAAEYLQANPIDADWMMGQFGEEDRIEFLQHLHKKASEMASEYPNECRPPPPWTLT